jgi:polysaccharide biosynthesis transport protein
MLENSQEAPSTTGWEDYWGIVKRRRWWFMLPLFLAWASTVSLTRVLPTNYTSEALILVQGGMVPKELVTPNVTSPLQERLESMAQEILSRTRLQRVVEEYNLYGKPGMPVNPEEAVDQMRNDIKIHPVSLDDLAQANPSDLGSTTTHKVVGKPPDALAFQISYSAKRPIIAQRVTSRLTSLFIEENLRAREQQSELTTGFLSNQLEAARKSLDRQEKQIREFKTRYLGELPSQLDSNMQVLAGLEKSLEAEEGMLDSAEQQKLYLDSLAAQYASLRASMRDASKTGAQLPPGLDQDLDKMRTQLAGLQAQYTERHPDVQELEEQIAEKEQLKKRMESELAAAQTKAPAGSGKGPTTATELQTISSILQIESQQKSNQKEIENSKGRVKEIQSRIAMYQSQVSQAPLREQELTELTRNYDQSKAAYDSLLAKANASELATNLERHQEGELFTILNPPNLPEHPSFPNRFLFSLTGLGVGTVLGVAFAAGGELSDDRLHSDKELKTLSPAPVLVGIPVLATTREQRQKFYRRVMGWAAASAMMVMIAAGTLVAFLRS